MTDGGPAADVRCPFSLTKSSGVGGTELDSIEEVSECRFDALEPLALGVELQHDQVHLICHDSRAGRPLAGEFELQKPRPLYYRPERSVVREGNWAASGAIRIDNDEGVGHLLAGPEIGLGDGALSLVRIDVIIERGRQRNVSWSGINVVSWAL